MNVSSIQKVEHNRFARADLEHRLLMVDDDMKLEALKDTNYIKSIVTLEDKMDLERKSRQSVQGSMSGSSVLEMAVSVRCMTVLMDFTEGRSFLP